MAAPFDLTNLATLKQYISPATVTSTVADSILQEIITGVSEGIQLYCSREFAVQIRTEVRNGNNRNSMRTLVYPIQSVASIVIAAINGQPGQTLTPNNYTNDNWFIYLQPGNAFGCRFSYGKQNITLNYTAGFITPGQLQLLSAPAWAASTLMTVGAQIQAAGQIYQVLVAGTTGLTIPAFVDTQNTIIAGDGSVTWWAVGPVPVLPSTAQMLPYDLQLACLQQSALVSKNRTRVGDTSTGVGPDRVSFFMRGMTDSTKELLNRHREVFPTDGMGVV
jgi:hypothetical protein